MSLKAQYAAALGNIVIGAHNWWVPLGGVDATGQPSVVGITTAAKATGTLAADGGPTQPTDGDTFVLGSTTYRFKSTLAAAYDIKIGASVAATFDNIKAAVNQSGTAGTEYFAGTLANPTAEATTNGDTSQVFRARNSGALGNLLAFSESITPAWTVTAATLTGGTDAALKVDATISATAESTAEATAAAPSYTEGQDAPLSQDRSGNLRVIPAATEVHLGEVGGKTAVVNSTLSLDTSAYASGDVLAETQQIDAAFRKTDGTGVLQSLVVVDQDDQKVAMTIYFLSSNVSMGTENAAPSISDANAVEILGKVEVGAGDYKDLGGVSIAMPSFTPFPVKAVSGTDDLYVSAVNGTGTPTFTAAGVKLRLGILLD